MSFKLKTIIGIGIIEAILLLILIVTSINLLKTTKESELVKQAGNTAKLFATTTKDAVLATDIAALESFVTEVMKNDGLMYARVISDQAGILAEKRKPGIEVQAFKLDQDIENVSDGVFDTHAMIAESGFQYGRVELGFSIQEVDTLIAEARRKTLFIAIIELFLSALFSLILGFYLTRQLGELMRASRRITKGELGFKIQVKGNDELANTATAFNKMSDSLKSSWQEREDARQQLIKLNEQLEQKVIERTKQLEEAQNKALEIAHRAGMADVAAGALHNIGNLINSAKTSTHLLSQDLKNTKLNKLQQANELLSEHMDDMENFVKNDPKSKPLFEYYLSIEKALQAEQESIQKKLSDIIQSVELTAQTIAEQQVYAKDPLKFEVEVNIEALFTDILALVASRIDAIKIQVKQRFSAQLPPIKTQKNKLHQVLFNLVINAIDAIELSDQEQGVIEIVTTINDSVTIKIIDNGCGIEPEMLDKIFNYGSTTKASGNGAGLHSSANLMTEMMGNISASSEGKNRGATFIVNLPLIPSDDESSINHDSQQSKSTQSAS